MAHCSSHHFQSMGLRRPLSSAVENKRSRVWKCVKESQRCHTLDFTALEQLGSFLKLCFPGILRGPKVISCQEQPLQPGTRAVLAAADTKVSRCVLCRCWVWRLMLNKESNTSSVSVSKMGTSGLCVKFHLTTSLVGGSVKVPNKQDQLNNGMNLVYLKQYFSPFSN